ncbi:MAG: hypothetical protein BA873_03065 [Desulfobulbaceae bacterium C00003063]|nr:MAG: hypothetical protein BA873_03065 [Desulfobulbaceae bacterium C00003063]
MYKLYEQIIIKSEIYQRIPEDNPTSISVASISLSPSTVKPYEQFEVSGYAKYDTGNPVKVGTAIIEIEGKGEFTATVSNGAFSRYFQAPGNSNTSNISSNVKVTVSDGLLTSGLETQTLTITGIDPEPEDYEFVEAKTCEYVLKDSPYDPYQIKSVFSKDDDHVLVWVHLKNLYKPVQCRWKWYNPDGKIEAVHESDYSNQPEEGSYYYWCKWHRGWDLRNPDGGYRGTVGKEGRWRCEVSARTPWTDWEHLATVEFTMRYTLSEHKMCKDIDTQSDPKSPTNIFSPDDTKAITWAKFINVADPLELKWVYYSPKGFYREFTHTTEDPGEDKCHAWGRINIKREPAEYHCGDWHVDVFVKDAWGNYEKKYTDYFRIEESVSPWIFVTTTPSSPFEAQSVNLNVSASDNNHLQKIVLHWKDSSEHSKTWDNINARSYSPSHPIGFFSAGQEIEYWAEAWDESGNHMESVHRIITVRPAKYTLNLSKIGSGIVKSDPTGIDCGLYCSATYDSGTVVTLIPIQDDGSGFGGWSGGGCSGTGDCTIKIGSDVTVTATFYVKIQPDLTLSQNNITFSGFSDSNPIEGDVVTITAAIHNIGEKDATSANVSFYEGDPDSGGKQIKTTQFLSDIPANGEKSVSVSWDTSGKAGNHAMYVVITNCSPEEADTTNNQADKNISVEEKPNYGIDLSCNVSEQNILPGSSASYTIVVTNKGAAADTINLTLPEPCYCGWTYSLDRESVELASGDSTEVKLIVSDVVGYPSGNSREVKVTGTSQYDPLESGFVVTITTIDIPDVTIDIFVNLEGSFRPDQGYEVPLIVDFFTPGADVLNDTPVYGFGCTTTKDGDNAKAVCKAIAPVGIYDITVVSDHTLMNIRRNVEITALSTSVSMGTLQEGDANGDGIINIADFGILVTSFMKSKGDESFDSKTDFDCNGIINIADFGLLAGNYMKASPVEIE